MTFLPFAVYIKIAKLKFLNMNFMGPHNIFHINRSFILIGGLVHSLTMTEFILTGVSF